MKPWLLLGLIFSPSAFCGFALLAAGIRFRLEDRDARRRIVVLTERDEWERLRCGAAWVEAMALTLDDIQSLPEIEPERWCA